MNVENQCLKQNGICAGCKSVNMPKDEESYGLMCHKCNKLYCNICYGNVHIRHNIEFWESEE